MFKETRVRVECVDCGPARTTPSGLALRLCEDNERAAPVLTLDDLLDFHLLLEDANWLASNLPRSVADTH